jgi:hypothetical protein
VSHKLNQTFTEMYKFLKTTYYTVFILINFIGKAQMTPQTWRTSCWAATTENILKVQRKIPVASKGIKECQIVANVNDSRIWCDSIYRDSPSASFLIAKKQDYINILKNYCSFLYLENAGQTLSWNNITNLNKPIIYCFDESNNDNLSHFVNIYNNKDFGGFKGLYIFDPYPTKKGTYYLKNYATYQQSSANPSAGRQSTYYNFGDKKDASGKYLSTPSPGIPSNPNIYRSYTYTNIRNTLLTIFHAISDSTPVVQIITGLSKKIPSSKLVIGVPAIPLDEFKTKTYHSDTSSVVVNSTKLSIIPVFRDSSNILKPISMIFLQRKTPNSTTDYDTTVIERIQRLNLPDSIAQRITLPDITTVNQGIITIPSNFLNFSIDEDGRIRIKISDKYYDISAVNSTWISELDVLKELTSSTSEEDFTPVSIDKQIFDTNPVNFINVLKNNGLVKNINNIEYMNTNNSTIKVDDFQKRFQNRIDFKRIILLKKVIH